MQRVDLLRAPLGGDVLLVAARGAHQHSRVHVPITGRALGDSLQGVFHNRWHVTVGVPISCFQSP